MPCCCEKDNTYIVALNNDPLGVSGREIGHIIEQSSLPQRILCQCWRAHKLRFEINQAGKTLILFESWRNYSAPINCCISYFLPMVNVFVGDKCIGFLKYPYGCIGRSKIPFPPMSEIDVCDDKENILYHISAPCCQISNLARNMFIPRCYGSCQIIEFYIHEPDEEFKIVGVIKNYLPYHFLLKFSYQPCIQELCSKADKFVIEFPEKADFKHKILLLNAAIQIDFNHFESTPFNYP